MNTQFMSTDSNFMSVEILSLKPIEADTFCDTLYRLSADGLGFSEKALHHYWNIWQRDVIAQAALNQRYVFLAAWQNKKMVGLLLGTPPEGGVGTIIWVLVDQKNQRHGIGKHLLSKAYSHYREMGSHKVKLTVPSKEIIQFYEKQGMEVEGFHKNHWWNMDMWSMAKFLQ